MSEHSNDPFDLKRFLEAQKAIYPQALAELRAGHKQSHWSWFIFPQVVGLGSSAMSVRYAIGQSEWKQHFSARLLDDDETCAALSESGFSEVNWIDAKWGVATGVAHAS